MPDVSPLRSPASLLASFLPGGGAKANKVIISGPREAGKSTLCREIAAEGHRLGLEVRGLLSPPLWRGDVKTGIDLEDLATGERRKLAIVKESPGQDKLNWAFRTETLDWGNRILQAIPPCDVLIIDELGPLEFERGEGLQAAFQLLEAGAYRLAFIVVRPRLLSKAQVRWPTAALIHPQS